MIIVLFWIKTGISVNPATDNKGRIVPNSLLKIRHKMEAIERTFRDGIVVEKVNLFRATMNEAFGMKENLIDDSIDHNKIIVDLSSCEYIDSTFFGALVYAYRKIRERDGAIVLVLSNTFLSKSFIYKEISSIFQVHNSIKEAVAEFNNHKKVEVENTY